MKVFNLISMEHSDSWNCLGEVGTSELMAQTFADIVLKSTSGEMKDAFWFNAELNLLKALVLYVALEMPPDKRNLGQVYDLLCNQSERDLSKLMNGIRKEHTNPFTNEVTIQRIIHTLHLLADNPEGTTGTCVFTCFIEDDGKIPLLLGAFIAGRIGYQDLLV